MISRWIKVLGPNGSIRIRFSQYGEDGILHKLFDKKKGFYIDVGAHHPFRQSNTARMWCMGWSGVNIDANPKSIKIFDKVRNHDINIWGAILSDEDADKTPNIKLNFSKELDLRASVSVEISKERGLDQSIEVPTLSLTKIVNSHAASHEGDFDFLNIDIEGLDLAAISGISKWKKIPSVIAIESYEKRIQDIVNNDTTKMLENFGYEYVYQIGLTSVYSRLL